MPINLGTYSQRAGGFCLTYLAQKVNLIVSPSAIAEYVHVVCIVWCAVQIPVSQVDRKTGGYTDSADMVWRMPVSAWV